MPEQPSRSPLRIAVTGASGFIGSHLVRTLTARGDRAVPIPHPYSHAALTTALSGADACVHLAGVVSTVRRAEYFAANVDATAIVAAAAGDAGTPLVHISSLAAAGPAPASHPRSEEDEAQPITDYGRSKLEGERAVRSTAGLRWIVLRPGVVYGPGDRAMLPLLRYARLGVLPVVGARSTAFTFIYIDDAVRAILAAIDALASGGAVHDVVFVGHSRPVSTEYLLESLRTAVGSAALLVRIPRLVTRAAALLGDAAGLVSRKPATINSRRYHEIQSPGFVCRVDRLRERLGVVAAIDLPEGLARSVHWYIERGWLRAPR